MSANNLICDLETGTCGDTSEEAMEIVDLNTPMQKVTLYYATDPICSHCWALEPVLRSFIMQYGHYFQMQTIMGGLLARWDGFADTSNGINKPADVAAHWQEVGAHARMPIDGTLWYDDPVLSSYPPSRVYKVLEQQSTTLAHSFLRRAREAVFAFNRNIGDDTVLIDIVNRLGVDGDDIVRQANGAFGQQLLEQDLQLAARLGARGFPTIILLTDDNKGIKITGARTLDYYVTGLAQVLGVETLTPRALPPLAELLNREPLLFAKEIEVLYGQTPATVNTFITEALTAETFTKREILGETYIELKAQA